MKTKRQRLATLAAALCLVLTATLPGCRKEPEWKINDTIISLASFNMTRPEDPYADFVKDKFGVKFVTKTYSFSSWEEQVDTDVNTNSTYDVFQWDLRQWSFPKLKRWANNGAIRPLPDDLSPYPNIQKIVKEATGSEYMRIDGKLYALPVIYNINETDWDYLEGGYLYRRDWAKQYGVYKENDIYTIEEFEAVLKAFKDNDPLGKNTTIPFADTEWAFPASVMNYYRGTPHSYEFDAAKNKYVWAYTTPGYTYGLNKMRDYREKGWLWPDQYSARDGTAQGLFTKGRVGVLFEHLAQGIYNSIRTGFAAGNPGVNLEDGTALMKVLGPDGKFPVERQHNWYSASLFSAHVSDTKIAKVLEILDWLLSEEGTLFCTYGFEGIDYEKDGAGNITAHWETDNRGNPIQRQMWPRALRFMASVGNDALNDPMVTDASKQRYKEFREFLVEYGKGMQFDAQMQWVSAPNKDLYGMFITEARSAATRFVFETNATKALNDWNAFNNGSKLTEYTAVLNEINTAMGLV